MKFFGKKNNEENNITEKNFRIFNNLQITF